MTKQTLKNIALTLTSSLLLIAAWPPSTLNFLLFIAFVPVMIVIFEQKKVFHAILYFYFAFQLFLLEMFFSLFTSGPHLTALMVGLILVPVFWSISFLLSFLVKRKYGVIPALILLPFFFVSHEVAQYYWDLSMTWFHLGVGLSNSPYLLGIYPYLGQEGGTVLIMAFNVSVYHIYHKTKCNQFNVKNAIPLILLILLVIISNAFNQKIKTTKTVEIAIFQPEKEKLRAIQDNLMSQIDLLETKIQTSEFKKADLIICPESYFRDMKKYPLVVNNLHSHPAILRLMEISQQYQTPILSGATLVQLYRSETHPTPSSKLKEPGVYFDIYNGSIFITPDKNISWRTKQKLVPFAEITPFYKGFNYLEKHGLWPTRYDRTFASVDSEDPYSYGKLKIAPIICFESSFPHIVSKYIQHKANLIVILSTEWSSSESLIQQHQDGIPILGKSFGKSLLFCTLNQKSLLLDDHNLEKKIFSNQEFEKKSIFLLDNRSYYFYFADSPWYWIVVNIIIILAFIKLKFYLKMR